MFRAIMVQKSGANAAITADLVELDDAELDQDLNNDAGRSGGDVTIDVEYSSINYKDGLAISGRPGVIGSYPLIPGIDLVGTVAASESQEWKAGNRVILNGWGIGERHNGGLSERARVRGEWLVALPGELDAKRAAAIGTAGLTAMLAVLALEKHGLGKPARGKHGLENPSREKHGSDQGDILVTGAAGGVGSIAVAILAGLGHRVVASTGRAETEGDYLRGLGAADVLDRATLAERGKPLQSQRWVAAIDSVGSHTLANVLALTRYGGIVASCGLAQGGDLPATVMPFILRAVTLAGINSVEAPRDLRIEAWRRLATDLDLELLDCMTTVVGMADVASVATRIVDGHVRGRTVVDVRR